MALVFPCFKLLNFTRLDANNAQVLVRLFADNNADGHAEFAQTLPEFTITQTPLDTAAKVFVQVRAKLATMIPVITPKPVPDPILAQIGGCFDSGGNVVSDPDVTPGGIGT